MVFIYFLLGSLAAFSLISLEGFVLACIWGWFVVPLGAPPITMFQAVGISILTNMLTTDWQSNEKSPVYSVETFTGRVIGLVLMLVAAWLLSLLV